MTSIEDYKEKRREYMRIYNKTHRKQIRETKKQYRDTHKEQTREIKRRYLISHRDAQRKLQKKWSQSDKGKKTISAYVRINRLGSGGKTYCSIYKRPYPENNSCELCGGIPESVLSYHHEGEIIPHQFLNGMWVCIACHMWLEAIMREKYLELKKIIFAEGG